MAALPHIDPMVNDALIDQCASGDPKAQHALYRTLHPMMLSICTRYERNRQDAVAAMNQGFLKILRNLDKRPSDVPFEPWARRIMINTVIDAFRRDRSRKERERLDGPMEDRTGIVTNDYLQDMEAEAFAHLLRQLPPMSRQVFNLFAIDGYSHAQIGELLRISTGTSKWHVNHARGILQGTLAAQAATRTIKHSVR